MHRAMNYRFSQVLAAVHSPANVSAARGRGRRLCTLELGSRSGPTSSPHPSAMVSPTQPMARRQLLLLVALAAAGGSSAARRRNKSNASPEADRRCHRREGCDTA